MEDYFELIDISDQYNKTEGLSLDSIDWDHAIISFRNVYFRYPGMDNDVLKDLSIDILPYEKLAIVGQNGSGKTTFVKLLMRLYKPDKGEILLNGVDIQQYSLTDYWKQMTTIFQDFEIYALSVKDNICFNQDDLARFIRALEMSGMMKQVKDLPLEQDTLLSKIFSEFGVELSQGQKQKNRHGTSDF